MATKKENIIADNIYADEKTVTIKLPRPRKNEEESVFVSVNERTWMIKKGESVEVPECVAEVLRNSEEMQEEAYEFEQQVQR